ncbi:hypothetical protein F2Q69_00011070 [Brassica cretica]|uniref:Uncharacterized protein n=1 Tax=Brassica cretica TaxID=69181 RepID=A0A8S9QV77_BRACR|nr:hypothetical protein F2Q69_00011070 [Brassica cretica]
MATARSSDGDEIERRRRDRVYLLSRSIRDRATTGRSSDDGDEIEQVSQLVIPDTHGRSLCSSLYESQNPASTHLLRSTMDFAVASSDRAAASSDLAAASPDLAAVSSDLAGQLCSVVRSYRRTRHRRNSSTPI